MIKTYHNFKLPELIRVPALTPLLYRLVSKLEFKELQKIKIDKPGVNKEKRNEFVIASLTSFPLRIETAYYTVLTLLNQTYKPDRLILWLAEEQFPDKKLPDRLVSLSKYGLEIKWCDNLRSHKKYYYAMKENKDSTIVIFDDDIIYPEDYLQKLYEKHLQFPKSVVCNKARKIKVDREKVFLYNDWELPLGFAVDKPEWLLIPVGCGGVLYPPYALSEEVFNVFNIKSIAFTVDDIWLKFMAVLAGTKSVLTTSYNRTLSCVPGSQVEHLAQTNCIEGVNNTSFAEMLKAYPEFLPIVLNEVEK